MHYKTIFYSFKKSCIYVLNPRFHLQEDGCTYNYGIILFTCNITSSLPPIRQLIPLHVKKLHRTILGGNKMPIRCNRGFYCRSYCLLNMFRAPLCPSSGAQEFYTLVAACGIWCPVCKMLQHPANRTHNPQLHTRPAT